MKFPRITRRITMLLAASALLLGIPAAATASAASATSGTGWIRLAHLSPNTPPVDVYLYSFGNSNAQIVLHHVSYGTVSPYEAVTAGDYSVAMRATGASPSSQPVLSTSVTVKADHAYTVAGMGPESGLRLQVLDDSLTAPAGKSSVRVIQASLKEQDVKFHCSCAPGAAGDIVTKASFASVSPYAAIPPGTWTMSAIVGGTTKGTLPTTLGAGTVHTMVVLDGTNGLESWQPGGRGRGRQAARGRGHDRIRRHRGAWSWIAGAVAGAHRSRRADHPDRRLQAAPPRTAPSAEHRDLTMPPASRPRSFSRPAWS